MTQQFFLTNCLMRTLLMKKAAGYVATASLLVCSFVSSVTMAISTQSGTHSTALTPTPTSASVHLAKNPVLARNTPAPVDTNPTVATAKVQKQDKKTMSRCWKRLMNMVREVHHAHVKKS